MMYNPKKHRLIVMMDIIWLCKMYYTALQDIELTMEPIIAMEVSSPTKLKVETDAHKLEKKAQEGFTAPRDTTRSEERRISRRSS